MSINIDLGAISADIKNYITANVNWEKISKFTYENGQKAINLYDTTLPPTNPKNMALLVAVPFAAVGAVSFTSRVAAGTVGLAAKTVSLISNVVSEIAESIEKNVEKVGDSLSEFSTRSASSEIKITAALTAVVLSGIGASILMPPGTFVSHPSNPTFWDQFQSFFK